VRQLIRLLDSGVLRKFHIHIAGWHVRVPFSCSIANSYHNSLYLQSPHPVVVPTFLDELPQGVGDPDIPPRWQISPGERHATCGTRVLWV